MALALPFSLSKSSFLPPPNIPIPTPRSRNKPLPPLTVTSSSSNPKIVRCPPLDRRAAAHNRLRFVRKLTTLLLSKPRRFLPIKILSRCRRYLALPPPRSLLSFIRRYPLLFSLSHLPSSSSSSSNDALLLSVSLTQQFSTILSSSSSSSSNSNSSALPEKLQKLLMLAYSTNHSLLLSKLVHIAPDLGLPPSFRSRLSNSRPDLFRTSDTSYGRALQLQHWDPSLALPLPPVPPPHQTKPIIDRPPKFKSLRLRRGLNLKRKHRDFLIEFQESPEVNPYEEEEEEGDSSRSERRACAVVREVLGMTTGKRTLVDHLTHFRKEFGLPNKLRAMLLRHPEMFYVSVKGERDSVFLVEAFDDEGRLLVEDEERVLKERVVELVKEGKRMRRAWRRGVGLDCDDSGGDGSEDEESGFGDDWDDGFGDLFESGIGNDWEAFGVGDGYGVGDDEGVKGVEFWSMKAAGEGEGTLEAW